jgi:type IV pilus assembly protein PilX
LRTNVGTKEQNGVVLIVSLILLVIISILAMTSLRNAGTTESVAGNVRTTEMANQAAEIALRHCEASAIKVAKLNANPSDTSAEATYSSTFDKTLISTAGTNQWQNTTTWDSGSTTAIFVLPTSLVGGTSTYKRPPECMVELLSSGTGSTVVVPAAFVITARGFGPEVASGTGRPVGTEVWLQSTIEVQ